MSYMYDEYLYEHREGVKKAYQWLADNIPEALPVGWEYVDLAEHDKSKNGPDEYNAYDEYFYGIKSYQVVQDFNYAWLHHIHNNPHHWQHWVLINGDEKDGTIALEMPVGYVIEMICDWWSFSFKAGDLHEIFSWYDTHKERMILHEKTRKMVEEILSAIEIKLDNEKNLESDIS